MKGRIHLPSSKSLRRRLISQIGLMIVALLLLATTAVVGINGLHQDLGSAIAGYQQLRAVYEIGHNVADAKSALQSDRGQSALADAAIRAAILKLQSSEDIHDTILEQNLHDASQGDRPEFLDAAMARLAAISASIRTSMQARQEAAAQKRQFTLRVVLGTGIIVVLAGVVIGIQQYRSIVRPLRRLSEAARRMAEGDFPTNFDAASQDREFIQLAQDFSHMSGELKALYQELERKVEIKSKELVRSERLASVGYLAAGVAHEINNPLGIITGYGERVLQQINRQPDSAMAGERARQAILVMCEEAYRCKKITDRLLSLARPGNENRTIVSLRAIADDVIGGVGALPEYRDRKIIIESDARDEMKVLAKDGEIKQVILNLIINALEAVDRGSGLVGVTIQRRQDRIELTVADNGRGMESRTVDRVFEPFFTHKRGAGEKHGTGLGLSITHAIIADHGGTIVAESDGPGQGSRFIVSLPAFVNAEQGAEHVNS